MSLILRSKCQPLLDNVGLSRYHVDINSSKHVSILGECGQPLAIISGIRFADILPTKNEINLAVPLFKEFIDLHFKEIVDFLNAKTTFEKATKPTINISVELDAGYPTINRSVELDASYNTKIRYYKFKYVNGIFKVTAKYDGTITAVRMNKKITTIPAFNKANLNAALHTKISKYVKECNEYYILKVKVDKLKEGLSSCNI